MAIAIGIPAVVITLAKASRICAVTAGAIATPAVVVEGCTTNATVEGTPGRTTRLPVTAVVSAGLLLNVIVMVSATLYEILENVATPFTTVTVVVPCSAPVPAVLVAVTVPLNEVTILLLASSTQITGCVEKALPAVSGVEGGVTITSLDAAAAVFVRWNSAGMPAPATVAVSTYAPAVVFAVNVGGTTVAIPEAFVGVVVECKPPVQVPEAPAAGDVNVTVAPFTGFVYASLTSAAIVTGNAAPTAAL
jgi:hypothetical protein